MFILKIKSPITFEPYNIRAVHNNGSLLNMLEKRELNIGEHIIIDYDYPKEENINKSIILTITLYDTKTKWFASTSRCCFEVIEK